MGLFFNHGDTKCTYQSNVELVNQLLDTYVKSSQQEVLNLIQLINNVDIGDITNNSGNIDITVLQSIDSQNIQQADIMIKDILNSEADAGVKLDAIMNVLQQCSSNKLLDMSKHETDVLNSIESQTLTDLTQVIYDETCITANIGASQNVKIGDITNNSGNITVDVDSTVKARSEQIMNILDTYNNEYKTEITIDADYKSAIDNWSKHSSALPELFNNILLIILSPIIIIVLIFLLVIAYNLLIKPLVNKNKPNNNYMNYPYPMIPLDSNYMTYPYQPNSNSQQTNYITYPTSDKSNSNQLVPLKSNNNSQPLTN